MQFEHLNGSTLSDPEKAFAIVKNVSGATISAGGAIYFDTASVTDGIGVSGARTGQKYLFAGILEAATATSSYGRAQVYGLASAYLVLASTAVSAVPGNQLDAVTSATYLQDFHGTAVVGSSAATNVTIDNPWNFVTLMSTYASVASANSTPKLMTVFVRAL